LIIKNTTKEEIDKALEEINKKYDSNVEYKGIENLKTIRFISHRVTLKVKDSTKAGHRLGFTLTSKGNRRRINSACWHVHGDFFDVLLEINENVIIKTGDKTVDKNGGNWQDWNIGSQHMPFYFSEACDCP
jgi:hypothetical protein